MTEPLRVFRGRMSSGPVAVLDIGSNSIKVLVAGRDEGGSLTPLKIQAIDARISAGISRSSPRLSEEGMERGLAAIRVLLAAAAVFKPAQTLLVATSAVRDAANGGDFCERVRAATGQTLRILTGAEEANLIGRGLTADPSLQDLRDFYVFDLGGGSLECLAFRDRRIQQTESLQLGCVRLTEKFVGDPAVPLPRSALHQIRAHTREAFAQAGFEFALPSTAVAIATGGTVTTVRAILGARDAKPFEATEPLVSVEQLRQMLEALGEMPLARRKHISGLPPARADVFPVALATLIAVAEAGGFSAFRHSVYNLRFGLADELLAPG